LKAVFIKRDCLLSEPTWDSLTVMSLRPGVAEGLQSLAASGLFIIVLDCPSCAVDGIRSTMDDAATQHMLELVRQGKGRVDALLQCPHSPTESCSCWGTHPGFLYHAAAQLELRLDECYLLGDRPDDVVKACKVGCRPILVLNGQGISDLYDGHQPEPRDFPIARDLTSAVQYLLAEEEATDQWGHPRPPSSSSQIEEEVAPIGEAPDIHPTLRLLSPVPGASILPTSLPQISRSARQWLVLFIVGGVWLSLGIAYILTHLYRVHPFPQFVWYLTLQFIPRPVRGLLFIGTGVAFVVISLRAFLRLFASNGRNQGH
jgi:D-glycero-D-manno-heptose 1,7-bisphosphate phosphatase